MDNYVEELALRFKTDPNYYISSYMRMEGALIEIIENHKLSAEDMRIVAIEATQSPDPRGSND